jgi:hypothetical protein
MYAGARPSNKFLNELSCQRGVFLIMDLIITFVVAFALGFAVGYGVREHKSRQRRRRYYAG